MGSKVLRLAWSGILVGLVACGGQNHRSSGSGGSPSGDSTADACPTGYPYCASIDACLLPGRVCPSESPGDGEDHTDPPPQAASGSGPGGGPGLGFGGSAGAAFGGSAGSSDGGSQSGGGQSTELAYPSTPGSIRCGDALCDAATQYCCSGMGGSGNGSGFETCSDTFCPERRACDEPSDCVGTEVCCFSVVSSPPPILASYCAQPQECAFPGIYLGCGSQADCDALGAPDCVAQPCGGGTLQTCGPITRDLCKK